MRVFVDESVHTAVGVCAVAAVAVDDARAASARADLRSLLPPGAARLHWNNDSPQLRASTVGLVAQYGEQCRVYLGYFDSDKRQDAARERCIAHMYDDLGNSPPFEELVLDKRSPAQDTRDTVIMSGECRRLQLAHPPTFRHDGTLTEELLWLADALAGAVCEHVVKGDPTFVRALASRLVIA